MYLMGVTMACLANPSHTHRNRDRQRHRSSYVYQGARVCLQAFLYLENVTRYHLKRIRHHVLTKGVVPRVHGNIGKKPHNTFSLDMYKCAEHFIKNILTSHAALDTNKPFILPGETRMGIYNKFKQSALHPDGKIMGYTTFRHFLKMQFPNVRFANWQSKDAVPSVRMPQIKPNQKITKNISKKLRTSGKTKYQQNIEIVAVDNAQQGNRTEAVGERIIEESAYCEIFEQIKGNDEGAIITENVLNENEHGSTVQTFYITSIST